MKKHDLVVLRTITCGMLEKFSTTESNLISIGTPKKQIKRIKKALDLIHKVNVFASKPIKK